MAEIFEVNCDHCGRTFSSDNKLWDDYDTLYTRYDNLMIIFNTSGYYDQWFCSRSCQQEAINEVAYHVKKKYGETCSKCNRQAGTWSMRPCHVCEKLICTVCEHTDGSVGLFCSKECKATVKRCTTCNKKLPVEGPDRCERCSKRHSQ
jgi:hypothetical protein